MSAATGFMNGLSRRVFYPLWDMWDNSPRLKELRRLEKAQWAPRENLERDVLSIARWAYDTVPFYRRRGPAPATMADFARLPLLTKDDVRRDNAALLSERFKVSDLIESRTGGSTGVSLTVYCDFTCQQYRNAAAWRSDRWSGWELGEVRGALWGNPPLPEGFKGHVRDIFLDRLVYLDTVEMSAANMDRFVAELVRRDVRILYGHAHSLFVFANHVAARHPGKLRVRGIISTSMVLLPNERRIIEKVFGCPVSDRYGCEETGLIAGECERHAGLHVNTDHLYVELLRADGTPAAPGEEGKVVITDLINRGQPLLRYAVGDVAVASARPCPCGRPRPVWERVVGRTADFLVRRDGSMVAGVSLVERTLTAIPGLAQMQIVQDRVDELVINVVPDAAWGPAAEARLRDEIRRVFGDIAVSVRPGDALVQERNGKYRFAICRVGTAYQAAAS